MKAYQEFKQWWINNESHNHIGLFWGDTPDECFKNYINHLSNYELLEKLERWSDND